MVTTNRNYLRKPQIAKPTKVKVTCPVQIPLNLPICSIYRVRFLGIALPIRLASAILRRQNCAIHHAMMDRPSQTLIAGVFGSLYFDKFNEKRERSASLSSLQAL